MTEQLRERDDIAVASAARGDRRAVITDQPSNCVIGEPGVRVSRAIRRETGRRQGGGRREPSLSALLWRVIVENSGAFRDASSISIGEISDWKICQSDAADRTDYPRSNVSENRTVSA